MMVFERKVYRLIIYLGIFSLLMAGIYLFLGSPDVAMAEAAIGTFAIIFFIVIAEKQYKRYRKEKEGGEVKKVYMEAPKRSVSPLNMVAALVFIGGLAFLVMHFGQFSMSNDNTAYLRDQYLEYAGVHVGGQNVVDEILMGYRIYDTLFEALLLVMAVMAVGHLSCFGGARIRSGQNSAVKADKVVFYSIRVISPLILIFGIYLISTGSGFQGGVAVATFFVCRYLIHNIFDLPAKKVFGMEGILFTALAVKTVLTLFKATWLFPDITSHPDVKIIMLILTSAFVGIKVACGFFLIFYRYIAVERTLE